jgi:hypothetical protein
MCLFSCDSLLSISDAALCSSMMQNVLGRLVNAQKLFSSGYIQFHNDITIYNDITIHNDIIYC